MLYWTFKGTVLMALRIWFRPEVDGAHNLPQGPAIIASNHLSFFDSFLLGAVIPRRLTFLAKSSYFDRPGIKGWLMARFFYGLGQIPVNRVAGSASQTALDGGVYILRRGGLLGIYPEGTRSPDGRLYRGRTGIARRVSPPGHRPDHGGNPATVGAGVRRELLTRAAIPNVARANPQAP